MWTLIGITGFIGFGFCLGVIVGAGWILNNKYVKVEYPTIYDGEDL